MRACKFTQAALAETQSRAHRFRFCSCLESDLLDAKAQHVVQNQRIALLVRELVE
jgi:hypothetical protein